MLLKPHDGSGYESTELDRRFLCLWIVVASEHLQGRAASYERQLDHVRQLACHAAGSGMSEVVKVQASQTGASDGSEKGSFHRCYVDWEQAVIL